MDVEYINTTDDVTEKLGVGDYKIIELYTGEKVKIILLDVDKDKLAEGAGNAKTTFGILALDGYFQMNPENTNKGGWNDCGMRNVRMERFFRLLPSAIRNNVKPVIKHTSAGLGSREIIATTDKCFLFSEAEIFGEVQYSYPGEDDQYEYFILAENRNFSCSWWLRSPYSSSIFCCVDRSGGANWSGADDNSGVALGFCI